MKAWAIVEYRGPEHTIRRVCTDKRRADDILLTLTNIQQAYTLEVGPYQENTSWRKWHRRQLDLADKYEKQYADVGFPIEDRSWDVTWKLLDTELAE